MSVTTPKNDKKSKGIDRKTFKPKRNAESKSNIIKRIIKKNYKSLKALAEN